MENELEERIEKIQLGIQNPDRTGHKRKLNLFLFKGKKNKMELPDPVSSSDLSMHCLRDHS